MDNLSKYQAIYQIVQHIPKGRVCSFGIIAKFAGPGITARMVGRALFASGDQIHIPAHRVVNREGKLTGKLNFDTPTLMQELLEKEGIQIKNDKVVDFNQKFWSPDEIDAS
ncbi:MAG TPA: MGMT family protein [Edaphocola sp.]|nr:MGMT family protein [Edaphocola sp.]